MKKILFATARAVAVCAVLFVGAAVGSAFLFRSNEAAATRNSSGTYSLPTPGVPFQSNQVISSTQVNNSFNDVATELTNSLERNGKGGMLAALRGTDGTVAAPAYSWTSDTGTGEYRIGSGDLGWSISGTKKLELTSSLFTIVPNVSLTGYVSSSLGVGAAATYPLDVQSVVGATVARFYPSSTFPTTIIANSTYGGLLGNLTHDTTNFKYITSTGASAITYDNTGTTTFYTAPSGTAGNSATVTARLAVGTTGVTIGASGTAISKSIRGTLSWTPGSVGANTCTVNTVTVTGAAAGADCAIGLPGLTGPFQATCNAGADTCVITLCNISTGAQTPSAGTYACRVFNP